MDLLTEAIAEQKHFELDIADDETQKRLLERYTDLRLPTQERARLAARAKISASLEANQLFNKIEGEMLKATLPVRPKNQGERLVAGFAVQKAFDEFQNQVRRVKGGKSQSDSRGSFVDILKPAQNWSDGNPAAPRLRLR